MTKIVLADDHAIVRQGMRQLLTEQGIASEIMEAATGGETLAHIEKGRCDLVVLDISLGDVDGIELLGRIKHRAPQLPVLMFSMYHESNYAVRALKAGAAGYLSKTAQVAEMVAAIRQALAGRRYVSAATAESLVHYISSDSAQLPHEKLSNREYQTLCMLGSGKRLTDVAELLSLSVKTVSVYRSRLLEKMNLSNNAELTYYVISNGLVDVGLGIGMNPDGDTSIAA